MNTQFTSGQKRLLAVLVALYSSAYFCRLNLSAALDGIITALMLMEQICNSNRSLHQLTKGFVRYPQVLKNVRVGDKQAAMGDEGVLAALADAEGVLGENGRILVRASGTEPVVRVMAEAGEEALCERCVDSVIDAMKKGGHML